MEPAEAVGERTHEADGHHDAARDHHQGEDAAECRAQQQGLRPVGAALDDAVEGVGADLAQFLADDARGLLPRVGLAGQRLVALLDVVLGLHQRVPLGGAGEALVRVGRALRQVAGVQRLPALPLEGEVLGELASGGGVRRALDHGSRLVAGPGEEGVLAREGLGELHQGRHGGGVARQYAVVHTDRGREQIGGLGRGVGVVAEGLTGVELAGVDGAALFGELAERFVQAVGLAPDRRVRGVQPALRLAEVGDCGIRAAACVLQRSTGRVGGGGLPCGGEAAFFLKPCHECVGGLPHGGGHVGLGPEAEPFTDEAVRRIAPQTPESKRGNQDRQGQWESQRSALKGPGHYVPVAYAWHLIPCAAAERSWRWGRCESGVHIARMIRRERLRRADGASSTAEPTRCTVPGSDRTFDVKGRCEQHTCTATSVNAIHLRWPARHSGASSTAPTGRTPVSWAMFYQFPAKGGKRRFPFSPNPEQTHVQGAYA